MMPGSSSVAGLLFGLMRAPAGACLLSLLLAGCESINPGILPHQEDPSRAAVDLVESGRGEAAAVILHRDSLPRGIPATGGDKILQTSASESSPQERQDRPAMLPAPELAEGEPKTADIWSFTLPRALAQALFANPDLVALRGQIHVNEAAIGVAKTYPWNPFVQAQFFPRGTPFIRNDPGMPASGTGYSNYYIWAMQRFELAHQTSHRIDSAMAAMSQVQWNIFQAELLNVAQTSRLYFSALYQKGIYDLSRETAELNEQLLQVVERRFKANLAKAADVTTTRVVARQTRRQSELARTTYEAALLALRQQLNLPMTAPVVLTERLADLRWLSLCPEGGDERAVAAELVEGRPDVRAAQAGVKVFQANLGLARAARIPDLSAGPIYETASDTTKYLGLRVQMNIPIFDTGTPLVRQREAEVNQQQLTYEQLKDRAALEAEAAIDQFERVRKSAAKAAEGRPDNIATEVAEITRQFEAGQADVLAVLATQNNLLQERRLSLDLLNQLAQSASAVIQTTGLPLRRVIRCADPLGPPTVPEAATAP